MVNSWSALALPALLIVPAMALLSRIPAASPLACELRRKTLHFCAGLAALSFPLFLTTPWMVVAATALVIAWMMAVRGIPALQRRFGCVLHDADRATCGEIYFALGIAGLLLLPHKNALWFVAPVLVLTFADGAAAIVGRAYPRGRFRRISRGKTWSGCLAFFVTALLIVFASIRYFTALESGEAVAIATLTAALCCLTEVLCSRGLDNLFIPAVAWLVLYPLTGGI